MIKFSGIKIMQSQLLRAVEQIDWVRDESMVVERLKTGELPPADIQVYMICLFLF